MRHLISFFIIFLSFIIVPQLSAQKMQTLISGDVSHGGFGGPVVKFSSIDDNLGVWVGGRGGWILILDDYNSISPRSSFNPSSWSVSGIPQPEMETEYSGFGAVAGFRIGAF